MGTCLRAIWKEVFVGNLGAFEEEPTIQEVSQAKVDGQQKKMHIKKDKKWCEDT